MLERMFTIKAAAVFLQLKEYTIRKDITDKQIIAYKIGTEWRIKEIDLLDFVNNSHCNND